MILKTNVNAPVTLNSNGITTFMFEDGKHAEEFIKSIEIFLKKKKELNEFTLYLMDEEYQDINPKDIYPIMMDCGKLGLSEDKTFKDNAINIFEQMVYDHAENNEIFHKLQVSIDQLVNRLEIKNKNYTIELQSETFDIKKMLKLLSYDIHKNGSSLNHLELRECYYDVIRRMNSDEKEVMLFILYPENYLGVKEIDRFMKWLNKLRATIVILTNDYRIIQKSKFNYINLIKHNKEIYNIIGLSNEVRLFTSIEEDKLEAVTTQLAYFDFTDSKLLVNDLYSYFLESNKT